MYTRNIQTAFQELITQFAYAYMFKDNASFVRQESRNGPVIRLRGPLTITYTTPQERVLINPGRNCNHFFHIAEALWMLAGRNDVEFLSYFNSKIHQYSDDGKTFHGAYGKRWWDHGLSWIIKELRDDPDSRRCYIPLFSPEDNRKSKDVCCNIGMVFEQVENKLNLSVYNRSNDILWGMLGANYVHFTILQEFVANSLAVEVGTFSQLTTNAHAYLNNFTPALWITSPIEYPDYNHMDLSTDHTNNIIHWIADVNRIIGYKQYMPLNQPLYSNFLTGTAYPALSAWHALKHHKHDTCLNYLSQITSEDWQLGCTQFANSIIAKRSVD